MQMYIGIAVSELNFFEVYENIFLRINFEVCCAVLILVKTEGEYLQ